jgi:hypothetical protein
MASVALGAPFVLGGVLKMVYDVLLYGTFKGVEPKNLEYPLLILRVLALLDDN